MEGGPPVCRRAQRQRGLLHLRRDVALHQRFLRHLPHDSGKLPHSQLPALGTDRLFRRGQGRMGVEKQSVQRRGIQRLETPRQSLSPTPQDGWHLQHLPTGVHPSQGPLLCGRGHSHAPVCHRRGGRAGPSRGGFHQDYLRLVGLWRTDTMDRRRASMVGNGTILGEHKPRQRLLPLRRDRKHL